MPLYFAYGSNMDAAAMAERCSRAKPLGRARLARHRPALMAEGYLTVERDPAAAVHGLLYDLPLSDIAALDRYEGVARGLYAKITQAVLREGASPAQALMYVGKGRGGGPGRPPAGYLEGVERAARDIGLPDLYVARLRALRTGEGPEAASAGRFRAIMRPDLIAAKDKA
jgi:gamma-glutamylcyclotransferase (GGCT)/AIG2-like uncharacterized protein YtfP